MWCDLKALKSVLGFATSSCVTLGRIITLSEPQLSHPSKLGMMVVPAS